MGLIYYKEVSPLILRNRDPCLGRKDVKYDILMIMSKKKTKTNTKTKTQTKTKTNTLKKKNAK